MTSTVSHAFGFCGVVEKGEQFKNHFNVNVRYKKQNLLDKIDFNGELLILENL